MYILGINAFHGDASACLVKDGRVIYAIEEERINRIKHWAGFPVESIKFCLNEEGISISDIDYITIGRDPAAHLLKKSLASLKKMTNISFLKDRFINLRKVTSLKTELANKLHVPLSDIKAEIKNIEHHRSHLASAFYPSGFKEAALLSIDGFGDFSSTMLGSGEGNKIEVLDSVTYPHSLGIFYTAFTQFLGFPHYGDEYKVMGLAPYGNPKYLDKMKRIVILKSDGLFEINESYFLHSTNGVAMTWEDSSPVIGRLFSNNLIAEFGEPRKSNEPLTDYHKDIAASVQCMCEETIFHILDALYQKTGIKNVCIAGGVAQNSVTNGKILERTKFKDLYIPSAGYDAGVSIGSALYFYHNVLGNNNISELKTAYLGPAYLNYDIKKVLNEYNLEYEELSEQDIIERTASLLANGKVIGWFQDRLEFGPRALGNRSVLVDPSRLDAKDLINSKIKKRESFRPFAPSILREYVDEYFETDGDAYFMEKVFKIKEDKRKIIPAVTHVDGTGRLQTVHKEFTPKYYKLIDRFRELCGVPILLNTSFNENEPIVNRPNEAIDCYLRTEIDALVLGNFIVVRK